MKKLKIILDIFMTIIIILLMNTNLTGLQFHEIVGISIFFAFLLHKLINLKFIKAISKNLLSKNLKFKFKFIFIFDMILLIFMVLNIITGILISKYALTDITVSQIDFVTSVHKFLASWLLIIISIHIGLHLDNFIVKFKLANKKVLRIIFVVIYIIISIFALFAIFTTNYAHNLIMYSNNEFCDSNILRNQYVIENQDKVIEEEVNINDVKKEEINDNDINKEQIPTLEEYLSRFNCGGCRKNCSLLNPKCEVGEKKKLEKINEYKNMYENKKQEVVEQVKEENVELNVVQNEDNVNIYESEKNTCNNCGKCDKKVSILDVFCIIYLFSFGTYYIDKLIKK